MRQKIEYTLIPQYARYGYISEVDLLLLDLFKNYHDSMFDVMNRAINSDFVDRFGCQVVFDLILKGIATPGPFKLLVNHRLDLQNLNFSTQIDGRQVSVHCLTFAILMDKNEFLRVFGEIQPYTPLVRNRLFENLEQLHQYLSLDEIKKLVRTIQAYLPEDSRRDAKFKTMINVTRTGVFATALLQSRFDDATQMVEEGMGLTTLEGNYNPLLDALVFKEKALVKLLLQNGAEPDFKSSNDSQTAFEKALEAPYVDFLPLFLDHGVVISRHAYQRASDSAKQVIDAYLKRYMSEHLEQSLITRPALWQAYFDYLQSEKVIASETLKEFVGLKNALKDRPVLARSLAGIKRFLSKYNEELLSCQITPVMIVSGQAPCVFSPEGRTLFTLNRGDYLDTRFMAQGRDEIEQSREMLSLIQPTASESEVKKVKQYKSYHFGIIYDYHIESERDIPQEDLDLLKEVLQHFPHTGRGSERLEKFLKFSPSGIPRHILTLAANAFDTSGNTMLGIACEYGYSVEAVQKLIDMGANLNVPDHNMSKLALHWAICNSYSYDNRASFNAVQVVNCLLQNGAKTDLTCYENTTPLEYAKSKGFVAAASLIEAHKLKQPRIISVLSAAGLFSQAPSKQGTESEAIYTQTAQR